jgi:molybdopterin-guanine dinucleotide biosynthesis protein A
MGTDKASFEFEGEPLARRAARVLDEVCREVVVASGDGRRLDWLGLPQVADAVPDAGPLGGIAGGLEAASHSLVAVLAVDMPHANPALFRLLAGTWHGEDAVVPASEHGPEPLHAVYARAAAPPLRAALDAGERAVHRALERLRVRLLRPDEWRAADPSGRFAWNVNRPADLPPLAGE